MPASPSAAPGACVRRGEAGNPAFPGAVCGAALRARARASLGTVPLTFRSCDARATSCGKSVQGAQRGAPLARQPGGPRLGRGTPKGQTCL